jgi:Ca-activated chloride channel family protein
VRLDWPIGLVGLIGVPVLVLAYAALSRRRPRPRYAMHFTNIEVLATVCSRPSRVRTYAPAVCVLLALTSATAALARPEARIAVARKPASIVLAVDMSGSMAADDVAPSRLAAAKTAIRSFVSELPSQDRVGLVTFSSTASVAAPLSRDHAMVLDALDWAPAPGHGTAIGDALARSVELLAPPGPQTELADDAADAPPMAILLLSDGAQTRGALTPLQGAAQASLHRIPVYSIALGTPSGVISAGVIRLHVPPDPETLIQIARTTGATFYAPETEMRLSDAYANVAARLGHTRAWRELTFLFAGFAALSTLAAATLSVAWQERLP